MNLQCRRKSLICLVPLLSRLSPMVADILVIVVTWIKTFPQARAKRKLLPDGHLDTRRRQGTIAETLLQDGKTLSRYRVQVLLK